MKSTVIPLTTQNLIIPILKKRSGKQATKDFSVAVNPEFLSQGTALHDFFHPDRIILGVEDARSKSIMETVYEPFSCPKIITNTTTAEMIKYASNCFLATKINYANEIGNICKKIKIDSYEVFKGVGLDHRINPQFFQTGIGFGGSCLPKDLNALAAYAKEIGVDTNILRAVSTVNENQPKKVIELLEKHISLKGKQIGVLGLSYKAGTDDVRESRAIPIVESLLEKDSKVIAYDPFAIDNFKKLRSDIEFAASAQDAVNSDAVLILTDWEEFNHLNYNEKLVIDSKHIQTARENAKIYEGICW